MREYFKSDIVRLSKDIESIRECSVYFLINENEIIYIGFTTDLNFRLKTHSSNKIFDRFYNIKVDNVKDGLILEKYYIKKFKPAHNIVFNESSKRASNKTTPAREIILPKKCYENKEVGNLIKVSNELYRESCKIEVPKFTGILNVEKIDIIYNLLKNTYCKKIINGMPFYVINYNGEFHKTSFIKTAVIIFDNKEYTLTGIYGELK